MAVPKRKTSRQKHRSRNAQWKGSAKAPSLVECPQCHEMKRPHHVCPKCGSYDGREVIEV